MSNLSRMSDLSRATHSSEVRILLTGGRGKTSSRIAQLASRRGHIVRTAGSRAPENPVERSEHVLFDWNDPFTHAPALSGMEAVYLVAPVGMHPETLMIPFIRQAMELSVRRFVLLSSASVSETDPVFGPVHRYLRENAPEWAVLRPSYFMQNFSEASHAATIRQSGQILTAAGSGKVGFVDAEDIAAVGLETLVRPEPFNEGLIITGPRSMSYGEAAEIMGRIGGREIRHAEITEDELRSALVAAGVPGEYAAFLAHLDTRIRTEGLEDRATDTVLRVTGREPRSLEAFVRDNRSAFAAADAPQPVGKE